MIGWLLGFAWGSVMWAIVGRDTGLHGWLYIAITTAMLGFGVAAFFGSVRAYRRGERVGPRLRLPFRR
jgi:hypothetical protein